MARKNRTQFVMNSNDVAEMYARRAAAQAERIAAEVAGVTVEQVAEVLTWAATTTEGRALTAELDTIAADYRQEAA